MWEQGCKFCNLEDVLVNVRVGYDMYARRGGWQYFKSEAKLQKYMWQHRLIGLPRFVFNIAVRWGVQVVLPNWVRGFVFLKAGLCVRWVAVVCLIFSFVPGISILVPGVFWYGTARAIHFIPICIFSLALYFYGGKNKRDLCWAVLFAIPCFVWVFRTSIMGTTLAVMTFFFFRYRLKSLPVIMGICLLFIVSIFTIPSLKQKMFKDDNVSIEQLREGKISKDNINSNARFAMWEHLMM